MPFQRIHGHARRSGHSREYEAWREMLKRCRSRKYPYHGGRGITVCTRWQAFENFFADMGACPAGLTLDRIDGNGHYEPGNCRWATWSQQSRNQRWRTPLTVGDETLLLSEWGERIGVPVSTLWARIYAYGWDTQRAVTTPTLTTWSRVPH